MFKKKKKIQKKECPCCRKQKPAWQVKFRCNPYEVEINENYEKVEMCNECCNSCKEDI